MLADVLTYLAARLLLAATLTVVIFYGAHLLGIYEFPLVIAVLFAIVIALPLGIWVFSPLRRKATASIAAVDARRRADREQLRSRLKGETPPET
jgi:ABC-type bacteriocin/lantibiotic exporter with double-glycine peptidase domain